MMQTLQWNPASAMVSRPACIMTYAHHANLKYKFGYQHFWAKGYYVSTVDLNEATMRKFIREQETHDQMMDKITTKELEGPFRGGQLITPQWLETILRFFKIRYCPFCGNGQHLRPSQYAP